MQLEARLVIIHLAGQALAIMLEAVQDEELRDEVEEDRSRRVREKMEERGLKMSHQD